MIIVQTETERTKGTDNPAWKIFGWGREFFVERTPTPEIFIYALRNERGELLCFVRSLLRAELVALKICGKA